MTTTLDIRSVGQIKHAQIEFGDLTVFVGPQATGKSIALQTLKLLQDSQHTLAELRRYGLDWGKDIDKFFDIYFGQGMRSIWHPNLSEIVWNNSKVDIGKIIAPGKGRKPKEVESMFFVPAQRVLTLREGWPRPFTDYSPGDPFAVREFSERLRQLMEREFEDENNLFPQERKLKAEFRRMLSESIFSGFGLKIDRYRAQKRVVLEVINGNNSNETLPYMVWSAGQREFVPLLLSFYWLMPSTKTPRRGSLKWVVIEEPEMGLHPHAISVVLLMTLELLRRGYKVCLSTHSPHVLDVVWALGVLKTYQADPLSVIDMFEAPKTGNLLTLAKDALTKVCKVYYFDRSSGTSTDISALDPGSEKAIEAGWGGLSEFSGRVADVVARTVNSGVAVK
jgi:hypothetical protein